MSGKPNKTKKSAPEEMDLRKFFPPGKKPADSLSSDAKSTTLDKIIANPPSSSQRIPANVIAEKNERESPKLVKQDEDLASESKPTAKKAARKKASQKSPKNGPPTASQPESASASSTQESSKKVALRNVRVSGGVFTESALIKLRDSPRKNPLGEWKSFALSVQEKGMEYDHEFRFTEAWNFIQNLWKQVAFTYDENSLVNKIQIWLKPLFSKLGYDLSYLEKADQDQYPELGAIRIKIRQKDGGIPLFYFVSNKMLDSLDSANPEDTEHLTYQDQAQRYVNTFPQYYWLILTDGKIFRLITKYPHAYTKCYLEFDLQNIIEGTDQKEFELFYRILHKSRYIILRDYNVQEETDTIQKEIRKIFVDVPLNLIPKLKSIILTEIQEMVKNKEEKWDRIKKVWKDIGKRLKDEGLILSSNNLDQIKDVFKLLDEEFSESVINSQEQITEFEESLKSACAEKIFEVKQEKFDTLLTLLAEFLTEIHSKIESGAIKEYDETTIQVKLFEWSQSIVIPEKIQDKIKSEIKKIILNELNRALIIDNFISECKREGENVGKILSKNITSALELLGNELLNSNLGFKETITNGSASLDDFYATILRVIYRIMFILYAEERKMLPEEGSLFHRYYSFSNYREKLERPILEDQNTDNWHNFLTILSLLETGNALFGIEGYGDFFSINQNFNLLIQYQLTVTNSAFLQILKKMTIFYNEGLFQKINYLELAEEEIGGIYEILLENQPFVANGVFVFNHDMLDRKSSGSYYTAKGLIEIMIHQALKRVVDEKLANCATKQEKKDALLSLSVLDPSCGGGSILLAATDYLGKILAKVESGTENPDEKILRESRRKIVQHCIYGVDINPLAVELCKISLWLRVAMKDKPLNLLENHIKCGNSLIGFDFNRFNRENKFNSNEVYLRIQPDWIQAIEGYGDTGFEGENKEKAIEIKSRYKAEINDQSLEKWRIQENENLEKCSITSKKLLDDQENNLKEITDKKSKYQKFYLNPLLSKFRLLADLYTSIFFWPFTENASNPPFNNTHIIKILKSTDPRKLPELQDIFTQMEEIKAKYHFFHWFLEFPELFGKENPGFDVILGNPPWDTIQLDEQEYFETKNQEIAQIAKQNKRREKILALKTQDQKLHTLYCNTLLQTKKFTNYIKNSPFFLLSSHGYLSTYPLFIERFAKILTNQGSFSLICPTTFLLSNNLRYFLQEFIKNNALVSYFDFENKKIFPIHPSFHFSIISGLNPSIKHPPHTISAMFMQYFPNNVLDTIQNETRKNESLEFFRFDPEDYTLFNPNTANSPIFNSSRDYVILKNIYSKIPIFFKIGENSSINPWNIIASRMFHMSGDSGLFVPTQSVPILNNRKEFLLRDFERNITYYPLYEGKTLDFYNHRNNSSILGQGKHLKSVLTNIEQYQDPYFEINPMYFVKNGDFERKWASMKLNYNNNWFLLYRDVTNKTNWRTFIVSICPKTAVVNTAYMILSSYSAKLIACLTANLCSFIFDYVCRQKIGGMHVSVYILNQLPVLPPAFYSESIQNFIIQRVVKLSYTSHSLKDFAIDCNYNGDPFIWKEDERRDLQAQLDALFFHLYQISEEELNYIMDTFPIVKREDIALFGEFRTKSLVMRYYYELKDNEIIQAVNWDATKEILKQQKELSPAIDIEKTDDEEKTND